MQSQKVGYKFLSSVFSFLIKKEQSTLLKRAKCSCVGCSSHSFCEEQQEQYALIALFKRATRAKEWWVKERKSEREKKSEFPTLLFGVVCHRFLSIFFVHYVWIWLIWIIFNMSELGTRIKQLYSNIWWFWLGISNKK